MPTFPNIPIVLSSTELAAYLQYRKDNNQEFDKEPIILHETGELVTILVVGGVTYAVGPEYQLPGQPLAVQPYTADNTQAVIYPIPVDKDLLLIKWDVTHQTVTTLDGTHYWTITLSSATTGATVTQVTIDNSAGTADTLIAVASTEFGTNPPNPNSVYLLLGVAKTSTPGDLYLFSVLTVRNILATLT